MKITVSKKAISDALQHCCAAATRKSTMPILKCVRLVPTTLGFELSAANEGMQMAVSCNVSAAVSAPESLCVSAHDLFDRVKALPDGDIKLITKAGKLSVESGSRKLSLSYISADDYPKIPAFSGDLVKVPALLLSEAFRSTLFAVCEDTSRSEISGLHLRVGGGRLVAVGTDNHRIAMFSADCEGELDCLIPKASAVMLRAALDSATGDVGLSRDGQTMYADFPVLGASFASSTLNEERFPKIEGLAAEVPAEPCQVMAAVALDSLKALTAVGGKFGQVTLQKTGNTIRVSAVSDGGDESSDEFMATGCADFAPFKVEGRFMIESIAACATEVVSIASADDTFKPVQVFGGNVHAPVAKLQQ